jgi:hypothetical protein
VAEAVFVIVYVFINIGIGAFIVGTITLLVVRSDEKTGEYRCAPVRAGACVCACALVCCCTRDSSGAHAAGCCTGGSVWSSG